MPIPTHIMQIIIVIVIIIAVIIIMMMRILKFLCKQEF